ncbi:MAG: beta-hydroxyacyl-ACP dehydratase [Pirellulaceae bacterium]|nr:MAG: beta-hydroxyacyl-ACP dehydratase [Pirellulaceae bacterium]
MRWLWIDRFVEFVSGKYAVSIKNVTTVEEALDHYLPHFPMFPPSLLIEGIAQTGGLLVSEQHGFRERVVLAKVAKALFRRPVVPGEQLRYEVHLKDQNPHGALVHATASINGQPAAEVELMFAHLDERFPDELFTAEELYQLLVLYRLFEVGRTVDGRPLPIPEIFEPFIEHRSQDSNKRSP